MIDDPLHNTIVVDQMLENAEFEDRIEALERENAQLKQRLNNLENKPVKKSKPNNSHTSKANVRWWLCIIFSGIIPVMVSLGFFIYLVINY